MHSLATGELIKTFEVSQKTHFYTDGRSNAPVTFSGDEQFLGIVHNGPGRTTPVTEIYKVEDMQKIKEVEASPGTIDIAFSPDKRYVAEYSDGLGWFILREIAYDTGKKIKVPKFTEKLIFKDDNSAICITKSKIYLLNCISGESELVTDSLLSENVAFAGNKLVFFDRNYTMKVLDISTLKISWSVKSFPRKAKHNKFKHCVLSPDSKYLATWNFHYVALWNMEKKKLIGYLSKKSG